MFASLTIKPSKMLGDSFVAIVLVQKSFFLFVFKSCLLYLALFQTRLLGIGEVGKLIRVLAQNVAQMVKTQGSVPGLGRSSGGGNGNPLSNLAWRISWTEKPGRLQLLWVAKSWTGLSD